MIKGEGNRKRRCKSCDVKIPACEGLICGVNFVCSIKCAYQLGKKQIDKQKAKARLDENKKQEKIIKKANEEKRKRSKALKPLKYWQDNLQKVVNKYVMLLRKERPCISCGNSNPTEAGHFLSRGAHPNKRYLISNIFPQCHECNVYKSGNAGEYEKSLVTQFGRELVDELKAYNVQLKEQFPHWTDYEKEIQRYKKLIKELE